MALGSMLAIYALFWWLTLFAVLPFRLKRKDDVPEARVPGEAEGAPVRFSVARTVMWTTLVSAALFALFYVNYVNGWVLADELDFFSNPERLERLR